MTASTLTPALEETLECFPGPAPRTTAELAEELDLGRRSTYDRLNRLVDAEYLATKKVGGNGRVWWRPPDTIAETDSSTGEAGEYHHTHEEFERLVEAVEEYAIYRLDADGYVQSWNEGARQLHGYEAADVLGEHVSTFYMPEDRAAGLSEETLSDAAEQGSIERESWRVRADGSFFLARITMSAIRDDQGELEGFVKVTRDMTNRRERLAALREQRDFTRRVLETAPVGVLIVDEDGTFETANSRARELLALDSAESGEFTVGTTPVYDEAGELVPPDERPYIEVFETGESIRNWRGRIDLGGGKHRWLSTNVEPLTEDDGTVSGALVTIEDITQLKEQAQRLERERDELETELETIFDRIEDGFLALDEDLRFTYVNDYASRVFEMPASEFVGKHLRDVIDLGPKTETLVDDALAAEEPFFFEDYYEQFDEWLEIHVYPADDGLSVYFRDITERKEREQELKYFEILFKESLDANAVLTPDGTFEYGTQATKHVLGYDPEEILGESALNFVHPEDRDRVARKFFELVENPELEPTIEYRFRRADGSWAHVESRGRNLLDDPDVEGIVVYSRDITERKERERELERTLEMLERTERTANVGGWEIDFAGDDLHWSDNMYDILGIPPEENPLTRDGYELFAEEDRDTVVAAIEGALSDGEPFDIEARLDTAEDSPRWLRIRGQAEVEDNEVVRVSGATQDVTQRKRRERQLERKNDELAALNSLNEVVTGLTDAIIDQSTREEIEATVCEHFAASDAYIGAWFGQIESGTQTITPRASAGLRGILDEREISVGAGDETCGPPTARAFQTGEIQIHNHRLDDSMATELQTALADRDVGASAAIPIVHGGTTYGVLTVYSTRPDTFEGESGELMSGVGDIVGHAIAAAERKRALMSDELVELEFRIEDVFEALDSEVWTDGWMELDQAVPVGDDNFLVFGRASPEAVDALNRLVELRPHWESVEVHSDGDAIQFELSLSDPPILSMIASLGGYVDSASLEDGDYRMTIHLAPNVEVREILDAMEETYPQAEAVSRKQITRPADDHRRFRREVAAELTDRQRSVLTAAYHGGYFEWPREATGEDIADSLDIAAPTFHNHLRRSQGKVFDSLF